MTDYNWRRKAKEVLYNYTTNLLLIAQLEKDVIYGQPCERDHRYRRGGISNPTMMKAQRLDSKRLNCLRREVAAVDKLLDSLRTERRIDAKRRALLELVYFRGSHSLLGASVRLEVSERTAKRWNTQAVEFVARELGWY